MKEMEALQELLPLHIDSAVFVLQVPHESGHIVISRDS